MMQPAECNAIIRVKPLTGISVPRDDVMGFDIVSASAQPALEFVAFTDLE